MKILDRYVLYSFLRNYLIAFMVLIGMYIVLDMVFNFDELVEFRGAAELTTLGIIKNIADYYFFQTFLIFVHLSGIIPVVAAAFTLIRLSRFNELSAILAAGVPLLRVAMPIIIASVLLQGLLAIDQELLIPNMIPKLTRQHDQVTQQSAGKAYPVQAMQDENNALLFAGRFVPAGLEGAAVPVLREVDIIQRDKELQPVAHITAQQADWDSNAELWRLTRGRMVTGLQPQQRRAAERPVGTYKSNITPDEIALYHSGEFVNLLSRERINELLDPGRKQLYGTIDLLRVKHFRLSQLIMNIVMLLVAIPCVLMRDPSRLKTSIFKCLVLVGLCMASFFIAYQVAGLPPVGEQWADRWPAIIAFAPILIFGVVAVILLDRLANKDT